MLEKAPDSRMPELRSTLLREVAGDARAFSLMLARVSCGCQPRGACLLPGVLPWDVVRALPANLEIPRLGPKLASLLAEAAAERDLCSLTLGLLKNKSAAQSQSFFRQQRRGRAFGSRPVAEPAPRRVAARDV